MIYIMMNVVIFADNSVQKKVYILYILHNQVLMSIFTNLSN